jgi:hypothetical protein
MFSALAVAKSIMSEKGIPRENLDVEGSGGEGVVGSSEVDTVLQGCGLEDLLSASIESLWSKGETKKEDLDFVLEIGGAVCGLWGGREWETPW